MSASQENMKEVFDRSNIANLSFNQKIAELKKIIDALNKKIQVLELPSSLEKMSKEINDLDIILKTLEDRNERLAKILVHLNDKEGSLERMKKAYLKVIEDVLGDLQNKKKELESEYSKNILEVETSFKGIKADLNSVSTELGTFCGNVSSLNKAFKPLIDLAKEMQQDKPSEAKNDNPSEDDDKNPLVEFAEAFLTVCRERSRKRIALEQGGGSNKKPRLNEPGDRTATSSNSTASASVPLTFSSSSSSCSSSVSGNSTSQSSLSSLTSTVPSLLTITNSSLSTGSSSSSSSSSGLPVDPKGSCLNAAKMGCWARLFGK